MVQPRFIQLFDINSPDVLAALKSDLTEGLFKVKATIAFKYHYNELGSYIFDAITHLPEYYLTRVEASIFFTHRASIASAVPPRGTIVDLGAGSCAKAASLFPFLDPSAYVAVDISVDYLHGAVSRLQNEYPGIQMTGLGMDFSKGLDLPEAVLGPMSSRPIVAFYPGSSLGNFSPEESLELLQRVHSLCKEGPEGSGLLIGADFLKPKEILETAYCDPLGVTSAFHLNTLRNVGQLLGSEFDVANWRALAVLNEKESRIESLLQAARDVKLAWDSENGGCERSFEKGETIQVEYSYKWTPKGFAELLQKVGFKEPVYWTDQPGWYGVYWALA